VEDRICECGRAGHRLRNPRKPVQGAGIAVPSRLPPAVGNIA
jgi:hypothetical protein